MLLPVLCTSASQHTLERCWRLPPTRRRLFWWPLALAGGQHAAPVALCPYFLPCLDPLAVPARMPQWGSRCIDGKLAVTALTDNSYSSSQVTGAVKYQVVLQVIACRDFSDALTFPVALGAAST